MPHNLINFTCFIYVSVKFCTSSFILLEKGNDLWQSSWVAWVVKPQRNHPKNLSYPTPLWKEVTKVIYLYEYFCIWLPYSLFHENSWMLDDAIYLWSLCLEGYVKEFHKCSCTIHLVFSQCLPTNNNNPHIHEPWDITIYSPLPYTKHLR